MGSTGKLTVLVGENPETSVLLQALAEQSAVAVFTDPDLTDVSKARKVFVITSATRLGEYARFITEANTSNRLQALLVRTDVEPEWVPFMLQRAGLRTLRNTLVHSGEELPARMLRAWASNAQRDSIANATVVQDRLIVISCAVETFEIGFDELPALARIPEELRAEFEIDEDGVFIHWPGPDV